MNYYSRIVMGILLSSASLSHGLDWSYVTSFFSWVPFFITKSFVSAQFKTSQHEIKGLQEEMGYHKKKINILTTQETDLGTTLKNLSQNVTQAQEHHTKECSAVTDHLKNSQASTAELTTRINDMAKAMKETGHKLALTHAAIISAQENCTLMSKENAEGYEAMQNQITRSQNAIKNNLATALDTTHIQFHTLSTQLVHAKKETTNLKEQVAPLVAQCAALHLKIKTLNTTLTDLENNLSDQAKCLQVLREQLQSRVRARRSAFGSAASLPVRWQLANSGTKV